MHTNGIVVPGTRPIGVNPRPDVAQLVTTGDALLESALNRIRGVMAIARLDAAESADLAEACKRIRAAQAALRTIGIGGSG